MSEGWVGTAEAYGASFARLCAGAVDPLVGSLGPTGPVRTVLDVGCGPGTVAAAARGAGWTAVGLDCEASMLALAGRRHPGLALVRACLPDLPFPSATFDAVAANFVLSHTPDPRAALREMRRVTGAGGRLALTLRTAGPSPMNQLWDDVLAAAAVDAPRGRGLPPERDFERTATGLRGVMAEAGLEDIAVRELRWVFRIDPDDLWRGVAGGVATIGQIYRAQPALLQERLHDAYLRLTAERYPAGELQLPSRALLGTAAAAGAARPV